MIIHNTLDLSDLFCKEIREREKFLRRILNQKLNRWDRFLFYLSPRLIKNKVQNVIDLKGNYGVRVYDKTYWQL